MNNTARPNYRELACEKKMHHSWLEYLEMGAYIDFYRQKDGDKVEGKVVYADDDTVKIKNVDSGKTETFKVV